MHTASNTRGKAFSTLQSSFFKPKRFYDKRVPSYHHTIRSYDSLPLVSSRKQYWEDRQHSQWSDRYLAWGIVGSVIAGYTALRSQKVTAETERSITIDKAKQYQRYFYEELGWWEDNIQDNPDLPAHVIERCQDEILEAGVHVLAISNQMLVTARLAAFYLNDYIDTYKEDTYATIFENTLVRIRWLCDITGQALPEEVQEMLNNQLVAKPNPSSGSQGDPVLEVITGLAEGVGNTFIEIPGAIVDLFKLLGKTPEALEWFVDINLNGTTKAQEDHKYFLRESEAFLRRYNRLDETKPPSAIKGIELLRFETDLGKHELYNMGVKSQFWGPFALNSILVAADQPVERAPIVKKLRTALSLRPVYPSIDKQIEEWWNSKNDRERGVFIGRVTGELILFFFGHQIIEGINGLFSNLFEGTRGALSRVKGVLSYEEAVRKGGKVANVSVKASRLLNKSESVLKLAPKMIFVEAKIGELAHLEKLAQTCTKLEKGVQVVLEVANKEGHITKILTTGIKHGSLKHWQTMLSNAMKMAESGKYEYIALNKTVGKTFRQIGKVLEESKIYASKRPDLLAFGKDGSIFWGEVASKGQTRDFLRVRSKDGVRSLKARFDSIKPDQFFPKI